MGCGFITWSLAKQPALLDQALARGPRAIMLSFGDPRPFAPAIAAAGATLICQCQTIAHVDEAIDAAAAIVIAQGGEAGGHGMGRGLMSFVPETADHLAKRAPGTILVAAGGIADGRGLAAALMLGAEGVLVGTRLWASEEALVHPGHHAAILATGGDGTIRSSTPDIARRLDWPKPFDIRVKRNAFTERWHGRESELKAAIESEAPAYAAAFAAGDAENGGVVFGEAAGLIQSIEPAGIIVERMAAEAEGLLARGVMAGRRSGSFVP